MAMSVQAQSKVRSSLRRAQLGSNR
jgi:hypothetical protein